MSYISCDICFEAFSELERVPRVLHCGHTFCSVCLDVLSSQICPSCKTTLTKPSEEYPINFAVLKLSEFVNKPHPVSGIATSLKKIKDILLCRREMLLKSIGERTILKNVLNNDLMKIQQMLEMDPDVLDSTGEKIIPELEVNLAKAHEVLFCCGKEDLQSTYSLSEYINKTCFLCDLANRLHEGEKIYVYERVEGKLKYGRVSLNKDILDFHVLDLSNVDKLASVISLQDIRKCVTKDNFQTFIKTEDETLFFSIANSSFLASLFIKLCTGETGRKIKGVSSSFQLINQIASSQPNYRYNAQVEHYFIGEFLYNDKEMESLDDYDLVIFADNNETTFSNGDFILQMFENGVCDIVRVTNNIGLTWKNAIAKMIGSVPSLRSIKPRKITDSGISLMFSKI